MKGSSRASGGGNGRKLPCERPQCKKREGGRRISLAEQARLSGIDLVTLEVIRNRLQAIADEMERAVVRSAHSVIVKEAGDCTTAIFTSEGDSIAHAVAGPFHLGVMRPAVEALLEEWPADAMEDGDIYLLNDPYSGGTHLPDLIVVAPVIHKGRTLALTVVLAHHQEMGGMVPGSMPATATEIFQEGLIIPPLKLESRGTENDTLLRLIARNVRLPATVLGDLSAQVGAAKQGRDRIGDLFEEYGPIVALEHMKELIVRAERMTREEIQEIPDGEYSFEDYLDHDGVETWNRLLPIRVTARIKGDDLSIDLGGSCRQTKGSANGTPSTTFAAVAYALRTLIDPATPINGGSDRPINLILPEGSIANPRWPAPVALRAQLGNRVVRGVFGALVRAIPDRITADCGQHDGVLGLAGSDSDTGEAWGFAFEPIAGLGARPTKDGVDAVATGLTNMMSVPAEAWETTAPVRLTRHALRRDSGGAGRWRGGLGLEWEFEVLANDVVASWRGDRHFSSPWGLFGGKAGTPWQLLVHRRSGDAEEILGRSVFRLEKGDRVTILGGGSGGYGDPLQREPGRVLEDVIDDKVSMESAESDYGAVVDKKNCRVNVEATGTLRRRLAKARGPIWWTFDRGGDLGFE